MLANAAVPRDPRGPAFEENDILFRLPNGELVGTGEKRPTPEQWTWGEQHMLKSAQVRPNPLGLARVNQARAERGQPPLDDLQAGVVPVGAEAQSAATPSDVLAPAALPGYVDNSQLSFFPPIRSQGSLNSCGQFSAVYYTLTYMTALARNWNAATGGDSYRFSPKWTYNMLNGGENVGSWHYDAYAIAQKHGIATWAELPYDGDYRGWCLSSAAWSNAINVRADQTGKVLDVDSDAGLAQLKQFLVNGYVLNFATYIGSWQWGTIGNDPTTSADDAFVGKQCVIGVNGTSGGHAMTIVGYDDDIWVDLNGDGVVTPNEKGALRIANSWGTGWGEAGFCWLAYQAIRTRNPASSAEGIFWYDETTWVTARSAYQPQLIAQFTVNHLTRNQLLLTLGTSDTTSSSPTTQWYPNKILSYAGGPWAFNGTAIAVDGTFCLDFTDLVPSTSGAKRYYLGMYDSAAGNLATLKSYKLLDLVRGREVSCLSVPQSADSSQDYASIDYDFGSGTLSPVAVLRAPLTTGAAPMLVEFDGSASYDSDGSIVSYIWDSGDGRPLWDGDPIYHCYYDVPGTYTAKLTVSDNTGAQGSATLTITITDPNPPPAAPSGLKATVSGRAVRLQWKDNSTNEQGFYVERAPNVGTGPGPFARIGSVSANVTSCSDSSVPSGQYYYRVRAFNGNNLSAYSNVVSVRVR
jgi:PKD domain/Papain family cysteine protease